MFNHSSYLNENSINNSEDIQKKLVDIVKNVKRVNLSLMEDIILELCEVKPIKLSELVKLLNRNDVGLRSNYLNKMESRTLKETAEILNIKYRHAIEIKKSALNKLKKYLK